MQEFSIFLLTSYGKMDKMNVSTYIDLTGIPKRLSGQRAPSKEQENEAIMQDIVKINQNDNVAVALRPLNKGEVLQAAETAVTLMEDIPQGNKERRRGCKVRLPHRFCQGGYPAGTVGSRS